METLDIYHLINGEYVHIIQVTDGLQRTYYTNGKKEGIVNIAGLGYAERKYEKRIIDVKWDDGVVTKTEVASI